MQVWDRGLWLGTCVLLGGCLAASLAAVENAPAPAPRVVEADLDRGDPPRPGQDAPATPVEPCAISFAWDDYYTVVVVGEGAGVVKPAWVSTYELQSRKLSVAYRATAYRDARGRLQIDARNAEVVGPIADRWSPDSFAFGTKLLWSCDDAGRGHTAPMGSLILAARDPQAYRQQLVRVEAEVEGGL